ncbi:zonular occludens toxin domain-containing protein [Caldinitratiruptor microaerophilus]|uniref:Zona occludens toxin N-terminal domain-containing protein n=1 Tax=Caldinitratiruptor microaerophilus TaxID=671077 RepID=A0AA35CN00_9FIRM|nr:zonular occludens toxin domain-containing protein [Caldinitratiruptor microaerophilus]BDG60280.1 hypothetical protein caldi_13700 [Caldinitratiruptor microaerophilus]
MIVAFLGALGAGKTLHATRWAIRYSLAARGANVYSNIWLNESFFREHKRINPAFQLGRIATVDDIVEMAAAGGGVLLLDEVHRLLDARLSMQAQNIFLSEFFMFLRKIRATTLVTFQSLRMVDVRLRNALDLVVMCRARGPRGRRTFEQFVYDYQATPPVLRKHERQTEEEVLPYFSAYDTYQFVRSLKFPATNKEFDKFMSRIEEAAAARREKRVG